MLNIYQPELRVSSKRTSSVKLWSAARSNDPVLELTSSTSVDDLVEIVVTMR
jgi:hypothetical protein